MAELNTINQLLNEIKTISESYKRVAEATGENFNIFSVLQMESDEVKTHSRFLAELLNPKGSHGQKDVFLKKFVERFGIKKFDTSNTKVDVEFFIGQVTECNDAEMNISDRSSKCTGGRIDILIRSGENVIMIENKIYAPEQPNQLLRYINKFPKGKLLYLTLNGDKSDRDCTENNSNNSDYRCIKPEEYVRISYQSDIINWLEECRKESVTTPNLREAITHYINLIKKLTGQNINTKMNEDIVEKITGNKERFEAYIDLIKSCSYDNIVKKIIKEDFIPLIDSVAETPSIDVDKSHLDDREWKRIYFFNDKIRELELQLCFEFRTSKQRYIEFGYGFRSDDLNVNKNHKFKEYYDLIKGKFGENVLKESLHYITWQLFDNYSNWEDLETLKNIKFGNFKSDFEKKVKSMLAIIHSISEQKQ
jgi:hypothetical protein